MSKISNIMSKPMFMSGFVAGYPSSMAPEQAPASQAPASTGGVTGSTGGASEGAATTAGLSGPGVSVGGGGGMTASVRSSDQILQGLLAKSTLKTAASSDVGNTGTLEHIGVTVRLQRSDALAFRSRLLEINGAATAEIVFPPQIIIETNPHSLNKGKGLNLTSEVVLPLNVDTLAGGGMTRVDIGGRRWNI